jgi:hypothetical protein
LCIYASHQNSAAAAYPCPSCKHLHPTGDLASITPCLNWHAPGQHIINCSFDIPFLQVLAFLQPHSTSPGTYICLTPSYTNSPSRNTPAPAIHLQT